MVRAAGIIIIAIIITNNITIIVTAGIITIMVSIFNPSIFVALGCFAMLTLSAFLGNNVSHSVTTTLENVQRCQILWF